MKTRKAVHDERSAVLAEFRAALVQMQTSRVPFPHERATIARFYQAACALEKVAQEMLDDIEWGP